MSEHALAIEIARCPLVTQAVTDAAHPCRDIVSVQRGPESQRQVPEGWAGALATARVLFVSSNPSISEPVPGEGPESVEAYPVAAESDDTIGEFITRRFDAAVRPHPFVLNNKHLRRDGTYAQHTTRFWSAINARAKELLGQSAHPNVNYAMTEVVHCKSKSQIGVPKAAATCAGRYLDPILRLSAAAVVVVVGREAHQQLAPMLDLPDPVYVVSRQLGGTERLVVYLPHPNAYTAKTFHGVHSAQDVARLRGACL